jgi:hypothetical protein
MKKIEWMPEDQLKSSKERRAQELKLKGDAWTLGDD